MSQADRVKQYRFVKGQSGNPKGRPKSRIPDYLAEIYKQVYGEEGRAAAKKAKQLRKAEIEELYRRLPAEDIEVIKAVAKWEASPIIAKAKAIGLLADMKNGKTSTLDGMLEYVFGRPVQRQEVSGGISFSGLLMESGTISDDADTGNG